MENLPSIFCVARPGYGEHKYISLCKNTLQTRSNIEWNDIEYLPIKGKIVRDVINNTTYETKTTRVCWRGTRSNPATLNSLERGTPFYYLPFNFVTETSAYPFIYFIHTGWLPGSVGASYKQYLNDEEKKAISLDISPKLDEPVEESTKIQIIIKSPPKFVTEAHIKYHKLVSDCAILSIPLKDCEKVSMLDCYHLFDTEAIQKWLSIKAECPVCKKYSKIIHTL